MTKLEMVSEMLASVNDRQRDKFIKQACKKSKERIELCYDYWRTHDSDADRNLVKNILIGH